ncbi:MAG: DUF2860 family protein, partial [Desulfuromonadales bacterium]
MHKRLKVICLLPVALMVLLPVSAKTTFALDPFPKEAGFSGFVQPGVGYLNIKSNLVAKAGGSDLSNSQISSLGNKADSESTAIFTLPFKLAYTFDSLRTQIFLGSQLEDLARFDLVQKLGVMHDLGGIGVVEAGVLFSTFPTEVWQDPYVVNAPRQETDRSSLGVQFTLDKAFGSNFELQYSYRDIEFDRELSGQSPSLGLSLADQKLLDRNRKAHKATVLYHYRLSEKQRLTPSFSYSVDDGEGDAISGSGYFAQLTYFYSDDPVTLILNAGFGASEADARNPIFNKTEESDHLA